MASINTTEATHAGISTFAFSLRLDGVATNIGDVTDQLWEFVRTRHRDEFEAYVREQVARR